MADFRTSEAVAADGTAGCDLIVTSPRVFYRVRQVSIMAPDVGGAASAGLYLDDMLISPMVPQGDAAAGDPPVDLRPGRRMAVAWTGADPGAMCNAYFIYDEIEFGPAATRRG